MYCLNTPITVTVGNCKVTRLCSTGWEGTRSTDTFELVYPRIIHGEFMTHRMMSRNASSSRATPITTMIREVLEHPYIPLEWGKNMKGMQAKENIAKPEEINMCVSEWLKARDNAVESVKHLSDLCLHKQLANRLLEPFQYIKVVATSSDWYHFIDLRNSEFAQPDIRDLAQAIYKALNMDFEQWVYYSTQISESGDLTHPYVKPLSDIIDGYSADDVALISAARCARVSYLKHDGKEADPKEDLALGRRLIRDGHLTPFEHVLYCDHSLLTSTRYFGSIFSTVNYRTLIETDLTLADFIKNEEEAYETLIKKYRN